MRGRCIVRKYLINSPFKSLVKTTRFKKPKYTARTLFKSDTIRKATMQEVLRAIRNECELLCKHSSPPSHFMTSSVKRLANFKWRDVLDELQAKAPTLLSVLQTAARRPNVVPAIVMAASILLKCRSMKMCRVQSIVSALLYAGHSSKRVCVIYTA